MSVTITNGKAFPGTSIKVNDNLTNIAVGDKLLIDAGIINTVILGSWNRLVAGASTVIQLGTKITATLANTINVTKGDSWHYSQTRQTTSTTDLKMALHKFDITGGTTENELNQRISEDRQSNLLMCGITASFLFTIGVSLIGIQFPTFKTVGNNGNHDTTNNPSTGEIINIDSAGITTNPKVVYTTISETLYILLLLSGQWTLARKLANKYANFKQVSHLSLDNQNLMAKVFSDPENPGTSAYAKLHLEDNDNDMISLVSQEDSNLFSTINIYDKQAAIVANHGENHASIHFSSDYEVTNTDNLVIGTHEKCNVLIESSTISECGSIYMDLADTIISTNNIGLIEISFNERNNHNNPVEDTDDENSNTNHNTSSSEISALRITKDTVSLTTSNYKSGIYIDNNKALIVSCKKPSALFTKDKIFFNHMKFSKQQTNIGSFVTKMTDNCNNIRSVLKNNSFPLPKIKKIQKMINYNSEIIIEKKLLEARNQHER